MVASAAVLLGSGGDRGGVGAVTGGGGGRVVGV